MNQRSTEQAPDWAERPVFQWDQHLTPERFNRVQDHHATRLRHALLGLAGPGVVYGYAVRVEHDDRCHEGEIHVGCGLAIDGYGRQLYCPGGWVAVDDLVGEKPEEPGIYTLHVHYAERPSEGDDRCGCHEGQEDWREESVRFSVTRDCAPLAGDCPKPREPCLSLDEYVCGRLGSETGKVSAQDDLANLCGTPPKLCRHLPYDGWHYAETGLPLACVRVGERDAPREGCSSDYEFRDEAEVSKVRPHVYRNDLLYELMRGCHLQLPRVEGHGLQDLSKEYGEESEDDLPVVGWADFARWIRQGLSVRFSKPVKRRTLTDASVFVTAVVEEGHSWLHDVLRLPVERLEFTPPDADLVTEVRLEFERTCLQYQLEDDRLTRFRCGGIIELTVRGVMVRDECGRMLDGRPLDVDGGGLGQAMPGTDFVAAIRVRARPDQQGRAGYETPARGRPNQAS